LSNKSGRSERRSIRTHTATAHFEGKPGLDEIVADLSAFVKTHPAKYTNEADFEPDGVPYSLIAYRDRLYTVESNHGQLFSITPQGDVREEIDISEAEGHIVPTSITERNGDFFVGNLGLFPITPDSSKILTLTLNRYPDPAPGLDPSPELQRLRVAGSREGFTTIVAVSFGRTACSMRLNSHRGPAFPLSALAKSFA
jgi:hypothetical protein